MTEYKVNLPKTAFPMRANLAKSEPERLVYWHAIGLYTQITERRIKQNNAKIFVLHDGPPYANGEIHLGHAVNKILKDIVNKSKLLEGCATVYVPGWDCHGLPIELNVEKKFGRAGAKITNEEFIVACQKYAKEQIDLQRLDFERLGVLGDFTHPYKTMSATYEANTIRALGKILANGYIERGNKPVYWCTECGSALAEAEVEYIDKLSPAIDVRFHFVDTDFLPLEAKQASVPIWTTTPWTLPANEAVALHMDFKYALIHCLKQNEYLLIAEDLVGTCLARYGVTDHDTIAHYFGKDLVGKMLQHPFLENKKVPIILGDHVTVDAGTGAVHTAPAHGQDDYKIGLRYNLPVKNPVGPDGKFLANTPFFAGETVFAANDHVIAILKARGALICTTSISHSYPHCWRHKTPLIFRATPQWFISMDKKVRGQSLRERALAAIKNVKWLPQNGENRIEDMISNRPDWCISRQRVWGTPLALFVNKETFALHPHTQELLEIIAKEIERSGLIFWYQLDTRDFLQKYAPNEYPEQYEKVKDTLDVWFDSGVSHYCVLQKREWMHLTSPADLYLEGVDQYRGWFQSSLLTAIALSDSSAPYKEVLTHGFTVDGDGRKMSKSLGNVIAPHKVIDTLGADILRFWIASTDIHNDLAVSDEILERNVDAYRNLRNTARFLLGVLCDFNPNAHLVCISELLAIDRFTFNEIWQHLGVNIRSRYKEYQFLAVSNALKLISVGKDELSGFYFSIIKDRLYTMPENSYGRRSAQTVLYYTLELLVRALAPILSFTAEEIWQEMRKLWPATPRQESVFLATWDEIMCDDLSRSSMNCEIRREWLEIQNYRTLINREIEKLRGQGTIGSSLEVNLILYCESEIYALFEKFNDELKFILITSSAKIRVFAECPSDAIMLIADKLFIEINAATDKKCARCWHYRADVGKNVEHPGLCQRCINNLFQGGEDRKYA